MVQKGLFDCCHNFNGNFNCVIREETPPIGLIRMSLQEIKEQAVQLSTSDRLELISDSGNP
ncbi:MAG: hypothetical protein HC920_16250 [Oscillatoriales cyanobacterium SM2_3_0]|nr:hypothetical protein [Oscillatoriales cyanobacterium SM2_3_0]